MDFLISLILVAFTLVGCARSFSPTLKESLPLSKQEKVSHEIAGSFHMADGSVKKLSEIKKPYIIFFVSETCLSCREETEHLLQTYKTMGIPGEIEIYSVLIDLEYSDLSLWANEFSDSIPWTLGSDDELVLYKKYFDKILTPSIFYYNPASGIIKKWQKSLDINQLMEETKPWY